MGRGSSKENYYSVFHWNQQERAHCWSKSYVNLGRNQVILEFITVKRGSCGLHQTCTLDFRKTDFSEVRKKAGMVPRLERNTRESGRKYKSIDSQGKCYLKAHRNKSRYLTVKRERHRNKNRGGERGEGTQTDKESDAERQLGIENSALGEWIAGLRPSQVLGRWVQLHEVWSPLLGRKKVRGA